MCDARFGRLLGLVLRETSSVCDAPFRLEVKFRPRIGRAELGEFRFVHQPGHQSAARLAGDRAKVSRHAAVWVIVPTGGKPVDDRDRRPQIDKCSQ